MFLKKSHILQKLDLIHFYPGVQIYIYIYIPMYNMYTMLSRIHIPKFGEI